MLLEAKIFFLTAKIKDLKARQLTPEEEKDFEVHVRFGPNWQMH